METNKSGIAQIGEDWQEGVYEPLSGDEELSARTFINVRLVQWGITTDDNNLNDYIARAWDEWTSTPDAAKFLKQRD